MRYTLQPGDTLSALARRFNTTVETLQEINNIKNKNMIFAGDTITVPGTVDTMIDKLDKWVRRQVK